MKCSRCGAKCRVTVTVAEPKTSSTWAFCPFHAERIRYILRCYTEAPNHTAQRNP